MLVFFDIVCIVSTEVLCKSHTLYICDLSVHSSKYWIYSGKGKIPCGQASDFLGKNMFFSDKNTCQDWADFIPSSAGECTAKINDDGYTKADVLKDMYARCCKPGSKPNGICGLKPTTSTPCKSKAHGEFLPEAQ